MKASELTFEQIKEMVGLALEKGSDCDLYFHHDGDIDINISKPLERSTTYPYYPYTPTWDWNKVTCEGGQNGSDC